MSQSSSLECCASRYHRLKELDVVFKNLFGMNYANSSSFPVPHSSGTRKGILPPEVKELTEQCAMKRPLWKMQKEWTMEQAPSSHRDPGQYGNTQKEAGI